MLGSLGRVCMALDGNFRVRHVSQQLDTLLGQGAAQALLGQPVENLFGAELFGPGGSLREALAAGEKREGWRASLRVEPAGSRLVSVTVAPLRHDPDGVCDLEATYVVVMRPADETDGTAAQAPTSFGGLIARSASMTRIFRQVENLQASDVTVLLMGESGTGKEVLARAIHTHSNRAQRPLRRGELRRAPGELLEAELFGHVRGAFTGAVRDRAGRFELAADGTLFLDEVGDLPLHLQVKLLRVLQERTFERVGESRPRTLRRPHHRRHQQATCDAPSRTGRFREDLYYRLRVFPVELPPLRERREDIEPLAQLPAGPGGRPPRPGAAILARRAPRPSSTTPGPETFASSRTRSSTRSRLRRGTRWFPRIFLRRCWSAPRDRLDGNGDCGSRPPPRRSPGIGEKPRIRAALEATTGTAPRPPPRFGMSRTTLWRKMRELGLR